MDLEDVDGHAAGGGELLVTDVALEVLGFLMLNKNLLVLELSVAIVTPHLRRRSLLLLSHSLPSEITFTLLGFLSLSLSLSFFLPLMCCCSCIWFWIPLSFALAFWYGTNFWGFGGECVFSLYIYCFFLFFLIYFLLLKGLGVESNLTDYEEEPDFIGSQIV